MDATVMPALLGYRTATPYIFRAELAMPLSALLHIIEKTMPGRPYLSHLTNMLEFVNP
jgi:hypothetical protein